MYSTTYGFLYTKKCRFMAKRVREISRFNVAPPQVFPLSVRARPRTILSTNISSLVFSIGTVVV